MTAKGSTTKSRYHELKTNPDPFGAILMKEKTAEFRKNDRNFKPGDTLILKEYNPFTAYSGRYLLRKVTHIQTGYGIPEGYAMLSMRPLTQDEEADHAAGIKPEQRRDTPAFA
jgi:hypothetical protein